MIDHEWHDESGVAPADVYARALGAPVQGVRPMDLDAAQRIAAHQKLDSHIVLALKQSRGEPPFDKPTKLDPDLKIDADGRVLVDITATVSDALLVEIGSEGGKVVNSFAAARAIRAQVPLVRMEALALRTDIRFIAPAAEATTNPGSGGAAAGGNIRP